jgi:hypothetical protein
MFYTNWAHSCSPPSRGGFDHLGNHGCLHLMPMRLSDGWLPLQSSVCQWDTSKSASSPCASCLSTGRRVLSLRERDLQHTELPREESRLRGLGAPVAPGSLPTATPSGAFCARSAGSRRGRQQRRAPKPEPVPIPERVEPVSQAVGGADGSALAAAAALREVHQAKCSGLAKRVQRLVQPAPAAVRRRHGGCADRMRWLRIQVGWSTSLGANAVK